MAKSTSAWTRLAAALAASLLCGLALAGPSAGRTAWQALTVREGAGAQFKPGPVNEDSYAMPEGHSPELERVRRTADEADEIDVRVARAADGEATEVAAALTLEIRQDVVWAVLNDFENMPRFVPDIRATRLIREGAGTKRVEVEGVWRVLFMAFPIRTTLDVVYSGGGAITIDSVAGNLAIHAIVRMHGDGPITRVDYQARIAPDFWLPPLVGDYLIGRQIRRQFEGMVAEMHRRAPSRRAWDASQAN